MLKLSLVILASLISVFSQQAASGQPAQQQGQTGTTQPAQGSTGATQGQTAPTGTQTTTSGQPPTGTTGTTSGQPAQQGTTSGQPGQTGTTSGQNPPTGTNTSGQGAPTGQQQGGNGTAPANGTQGGNGTGQPQNGTQGQGQGQQAPPPLTVCGVQANGTGNGTQAANGSQPTNGTQATTGINSTSNSSSQCVQPPQQPGGQQGGGQGGQGGQQQGPPPGVQGGPVPAAGKNGTQVFRAPPPKNCSGNTSQVGSFCAPQGCQQQANALVPQANPQGAAVIPLKLGVAVSLSGSNLQVIINFPDNSSNPLLQSDNKNSCVSAQLYNYGVGFSNEQVDNSVITSSMDSTGLMRSWSFLVPSSLFGSRILTDTNNANYTVLQGFYGIKFTIDGSKAVSAYVSFSQQINPTFTQLIGGLQFATQVPASNSACNTAGSCVDRVDVRQQFCTDATCTNCSAQPTLTLNENFIVCASISTPEFTSLSITNASVTFTGNGTVRTIRESSEVVNGSTTVFTFNATFLINNFNAVVQAQVVNATSSRILDGEVVQGEVIQHSFLQTTSTSTSTTTGTLTTGTTVNPAPAVGTGTTGTCIQVSSVAGCPSSSMVSTYNANACGAVVACNDPRNATYSGASIMSIAAFALVYASFI